MINLQLDISRLKKGGEITRGDITTDPSDTKRITTKNFLEGNIGENLHSLQIVKDFSDSSKNVNHKRKNDKVYFIRIKKNFFQRHN